MNTTEFLNITSLIVPDRDMEEDFSVFQLVNIEPEAIVLGDMGDGFTPELLNHVFNNIVKSIHIYLFNF